MTPSQLVREAAVLRCRADARAPCQDTLAVEEPLEIRVGEERLTVLMRTPGHDCNLAVGFFLTEGLLESPAQIGDMEYCRNTGNPDERNVLVLRPAPGCRVVAPERRFYGSSACGVCGKSSIESVLLGARPPCGSFAVSREALLLLPDALRRAQTAFEVTGGMHGAGLFDAQGRLLCVREDVGRHNAVDKAIGALAIDGRFPLPDVGLLVSGRTSFEVCQKAAMAGIPLVAGISAPSSLAVELAQTLGMTLVGFLRGTSCNIYAGEERVLRRSPP